MRWVLMAVSVTVWSCGGAMTSDAGNDGGDSSEADAGAPDAGDTRLDIPDPGTAPSPNTWQTKTTMDHGSPLSARPMGVVTQAPSYIGDAVSQTTRSTFFVFKTGPMFTTFTVTMTKLDAPIAFVHMHDGEGLKFGAVVADRGVAPPQYAWGLQSDHIYVMEVHLADGPGVLF